MKKRKETHEKPVLSYDKKERGKNRNFYWLKTKIIITINKLIIVPIINVMNLKKKWKKNWGKNMKKFLLWMEKKINFKLKDCVTTKNK